MIKDMKKTKYVVYGTKKGGTRLLVLSSRATWALAMQEKDRLLATGEYTEIQIFRASLVKTFK